VLVRVPQGGRRGAAELQSRIYDSWLAAGDRRLRSRCTQRRDFDHFDARVRQDCVERGRELSGPIADEEPEPRALFVEVHDEVAGLLGIHGPSGFAVTPRTCR
jgi:hypothetical protein